jgi:hypothetical protein
MTDFPLFGRNPAHADPIPDDGLPRHPESRHAG